MLFGQLPGTRLGVAPVVEGDDAVRPVRGREGKAPVGSGQQVWIFVALMELVSADGKPVACREDHPGSGQRLAVRPADQAVDPRSFQKPDVEDLVPGVVFMDARDAREITLRLNSDLMGVSPQ